MSNRGWMLKNRHANYSIILWANFSWKFWEGWQLVQISLLVWWKLLKTNWHLHVFSSLWAHHAHIHYWTSTFLVPRYIHQVWSHIPHMCCPLKVRDSLWLFVICKSQVKRIVLVYCILYHWGCSSTVVFHPFCWRKLKGNCFGHLFPGALDIVDMLSKL
jgi:hypothetical protein